MVALDIKTFIFFWCRIKKLVRRNSGPNPQIYGDLPNFGDSRVLRGFFSLFAYDAIVKLVSLLPNLKSSV